MNLVEKNGYFTCNRCGNRRPLIALKDAKGRKRFCTDTKWCRNNKVTTNAKEKDKQENASDAAISNVETMAKP